MPYITCSFHSECLGKTSNLVVILPRQSDMDYRKKFPVLYLLHGLSDDHSVWQRRTSLERYCDEFGIAAVLPEGGRSFYCDMVSGDRVYSHIVEEVIPFCEAVFPLADDRDHRFIAGNSMGGYGAYKIALKNPGLFSRAAALSGVMDIQDMIAIFPQYEKDWQLCFGGQSAPAEEDLFCLLKQAERLPRLYQCCGTADFLYHENLRFRDYAAGLGVELHYEEEEGAVHDWPYWDAQLPKILDWMMTARDNPK